MNTKILVLTPQPILSANNWHPSSHMPSQKTSLVPCVGSKSEPVDRPRAFNRSFWPTSSRLISSLGQSSRTLKSETRHQHHPHRLNARKIFKLPYRSFNDANGWTTNDEPIIISRSHFGKSSCEWMKNEGGRFSPKNTISGFTIPPQILQMGIWSKKILAEREYCS